MNESVSVPVGHIKVLPKATAGPQVLHRNEIILKEPLLKEIQTNVTKCCQRSAVVQDEVKV